jgi:tRNA uridine 5-carboxymethylaminomethyl modification enzyme
MRFAEEWRLALERNLNIDFWQEMVSGLIVENNQVVGVKTQLGIEFRAKSVVLTNGTFLNGLIHIGEKTLEVVELLKEKQQESLSNWWNLALKLVE